MKFVSIAARRTKLTDYSITDHDALHDRNQRYRHQHNWPVRIAARENSINRYSLHRYLAQIAIQISIWNNMNWLHCACQFSLNVMLKVQASPLHLNSIVKIFPALVSNL